MPQCKEVHPDSPSPDIFLCVGEKGHDDPPVTYRAGSDNYYWSDDGTRG